MDKHFETYGPMAEDVLEAIVLYPPHFSSSRHPQKDHLSAINYQMNQVVDYGAGQLIIAVNTLNNRPQSRRRGRAIKFLGDEAFILNSRGEIKPNEDHPSFKYWTTHKELPHPTSLYALPNPGL